MQLDYNLEIKFDRTNMTYRPNDMMNGTVKVIFSDTVPRNLQILLLSYRAEGVLCSQNKDTNKELEKISSNLPPMNLFLSEGKLAQAGTIFYEKNTFPFSFQLQAGQDRKIIETYVGVYIAVAYEISVELRLQSGILVRQVQPFFVQVPNQGKDRIPKEKIKYPWPENFRITPEKLFSNSANKPNAKFRLSGVMDTTVCSFNDDYHGSVIIEECDSDIRSIDLQLIRVEKIENRLGKISEATEIQLIQIIEGNATRGIEIPFNMIFPKFFSCPNFNFKEYSGIYQLFCELLKIKVDFELNLIMILFDGFKVTLNFPLTICRF